jgi:hypothetical protein
MGFEPTAFALRRQRAPAALQPLNEKAIDIKKYEKTIYN